MFSKKPSLAEPPSADVESTILQGLWSQDPNVLQTQPELYRPYFRYYSTECRRLRLGNLEETWEISTMAATTHADILVLVRTLSFNTELRRPEIRSLLLHQFRSADEKSLNRSIDFALRIWITMNVRDECFRMHTPGTQMMTWDDTSSLRDFVCRHFPNTTTTPGALQLDHTMTAANVCRLTGISIEWTPYLAEHLKFDKQRRLLRVYPFKQILMNHLQISLEATSSGTPPKTPIPISVLKETLLSLSFLFPRWDSHTDNFMLQHGQNFHLEDGMNDEVSPTSFAEFDHWRGRLLELHQVFHSPPVGWTQIWADRRNPLQWYTFWIAIVILILTVVFGVISSVTAILQTRYSYESLLLARSQASP